MRKWSEPSISQLGFSKTKGYFGSTGDDALWDDETEKKNEDKLNQDSGNCPQCSC